MTMRAVTLNSFGGPEKLTISEVPIPTLRNEEDVLIKVMAAGINRADVSQRQGHYPPPPGASEVLGLEVSGVVEEVGKSVKSFKPGDKVMSLLGGGGYAEYAVSHVGSVMRMPNNYSFIEAAAIPEAFLTAWQCLKFHGNVQKGQHVLVHAGASGVGTAACQLVECYFQAKAVTTSSTGKLAICKNFASYCIDRTPDETGLCFAPKVKATVGESVIDLVLDPVAGGTYLSEDATVLRADGKVVVLAMMGGSSVDLSLIPFFAKAATVQFTTLRNRSNEYKQQLAQTFHSEVVPLLDDKRIAPVVHRVFPLEEVQEAHRHMEGGSAWGKIILSVREE